jgi:hypothetical protein
MKNIYYFINNKMKILLILYEHQVRTDNKSFCPLSQQEISALVPCSKIQTNQIIRELIKEGYIEKLRCRGRYTLLQKSEEVINIFVGQL